jgi:hypothetical protein
MGIPIFFILVLFLKFFQFFSSFSSFFYFPNKKTSTALAVRGFARLFCVCPRSITSGLLYRDGTNSIKNYSQFSVFGGRHD